MKREFEPINKNLTEVQSFQGSLFAVYKIKQGSFEFQHSKRSLLFLKVILVTLFFSLFLSFSVLANPTEPTKEETSEDTGKTVRQIEKECESDKDTAKTETTQSSPESMAMMTQVASQAASMGGNIKTGHKVSAGINTTLALTAGKRCQKCKAAISECKSSCDAEDQCQTFLLEDKTKCMAGEGKGEGADATFTCVPELTELTPPRTCQTECNPSYTTCQKTLTETIKECEELSSLCGQVCAQAAMAAMMAAGSFDQLRKLCDGSDCDASNNIQTGSDPELQMPDSIKVGAGDGIRGASGTTLGKGSNQQALGAKPSFKNVDPSKEKKKENTPDKNKPRNTGSLSASSVSDFGEDGGTYDQDSLLGSLDSKGLNNSLKAGKKANKNKKSNDKLASHGSFKINQSLFAKGSGSQKAALSSAGSSFGSRSDSIEENKDEELETNRLTANKKDSGINSSDNIFKKASYVINKFCSSGKC